MICFRFALKYSRKKIVGVLGETGLAELFLTIIGAM
jgi:hypothetical protein